MLSSLLKKRTDQEHVSIVSIVEKIGNTTYSVKDSKSRQYTVEGSENYIVGQTVTIKKGIIVGITRSLNTFKEIIV